MTHQQTGHRTPQQTDGAPSPSVGPSSGDPANVPMLALRRELTAALHELDGKSFFVIEDPVFGRFFRLGAAEWQFACQLTGKQSLQQAYHAFRAAGENKSSTKSVSLVPERIEPLCRWLLQNGLIERRDIERQNAERQNAEQPSQPSPHPTADPQVPFALNPFFIKIPLLRPDRFLARLLPYCQWIMTWPCFVAWLFLCAGGLYAIYSELPRFIETARTFLAPQTWIYLWGTWLLLKVVHETAHGVACKKYGGFVGDAGAALILFSPVAYVDVTSAWRFRSRWHRVITSAAGIYVEFAVAAVAAIVWSQTTSVTLGYVCHAVIMAASITTVLFNANPLMRFDGYYMLSDALNTQNLYMDGRHYVHAIASRIFLGQIVPVKLPSGWRRHVVRIHGLGAACWRVLVCISMVIGAGALFHGAGLVVAAFGVVAWLIVPVLKFGKNLMGSSPDKLASRRRFGKSIAVMVAGLTAVAFCPWPGGMRVPAVVAYEPIESLRAQTPGFVHRVHVTPRQDVTAGTLLISLTNADLQAELRQVQCELEQTRIRAQTLNRRREIGAYQAELEQVKALEQRHNHLAHQCANLEIRSPMNGRVVDSGLDALVGLYVEIGTPLLRVASEDQKQIHVAIPESFVESFVEYIGKSPRVAIRGDSRSGRLGQLVKVEPRATVTLRSPALGAHNGGPLPVEAAGEQRESEEKMRLVAPRFHGEIALSTADAKRLRDGQLASVTIHDRHETVARKVVRGVTDWINNKITRSGYSS